MVFQQRLVWGACAFLVTFFLPLLGARSAEPPLEQHLARITFKKVDYREVPLDEALTTWMKMVQARNPRKFSVRLFERSLADPAGAQPKVAGLAPVPAAEFAGPTRVTLSLSNVPALEVLKYLANLSNYHLDFTDNGLSLSAEQPRRLDFIKKSFAMPPAAMQQAKAEFAQGPLPRPQFTLEGALALNCGLPTGVSVRWNAKRDVVTVEGHVDDVDRVGESLSAWNYRPPKPPRPLKMTEAETKHLALYERLNSLVLRDVLIGKAKLADAIAALDQLCIEASGKKTGGLGFIMADGLSKADNEPIHLEAKEITAWKALKEILRQCNLLPRFGVSRGRLVLSGEMREAGIPGQAEQEGGFVIGEFSVPQQIFRSDSLNDLRRDQEEREERGPVQSAKDFLSSSGVTFNTGTFAMYSPASQTLVVKDTPERLLQIKREVCNAWAQLRAGKLPTEPVITDGNVPIPDKRPK
jgi:hypothetical protein